MPPKIDARMGAPTKWLWERLTWDWQPLEPLVQQCMETVAPGKALRKYKTSKESYKRRRGADVPEERQKELTEDEQIESGRREIVWSAVNTLSRKGATFAERKDISPPGSTKPEWVIRKLAADIPPGEHCPHCGTIPHPVTTPEGEPSEVPKVQLPENVIPFYRERSVG